MILVNLNLKSSLNEIFKNFNEMVQRMIKAQNNIVVAFVKREILFLSVQVLLKHLQCLNLVKSQHGFMKLFSFNSLYITSNNTNWRIQNVMCIC